LLTKYCYEDNFNKILGGVKQFGGTAEWGLKAIVSDSLPNSMFVENAKLNPATRDFVEIAIKLPTNVLLPIDSHWPRERYADVVKAFNENDKESLKDSRRLLASAIKKKALEVKEKYINPPISTDFAIIYAPTEGLYAELASFRDQKTKELLLEELRKKYKITIAGPNTLCAILQAYHLGFQTLKVQKHATQIHDDLKNISTRFSKHFDGIKTLRKKLEEAMKVTDDFGRDARSITRTLENIKDPEQVEKAINEDIDKIKVLNK